METRRLHQMVLGLAVVLLAVAAVLLFKAQDSSNDANENLALVDKARTEVVGDSVMRGLTQVLSYDYAQPQATQAMAEQVLDGQARREYDSLFKGLKERAPGQKLILGATVQAYAVQELTPTAAKLLVHLDQSSQRAGEKDQTITAAQLRVEAKLQGDRWMITGLQLL